MKGVFSEIGWLWWRSPIGASASKLRLVAIWFVGGAVLGGVRKGRVVYGEERQFFFVTGRFVTILLQSLWK